MDPSEARLESLQLHQELRTAMREALLLSRRVRNGDLKAGPALKTAAHALENAIRRQVATENHDLAPVLRNIDAWGKVRCQQLENAHQQEMLAVERARQAEANIQIPRPPQDPASRQCWIDFAVSVHTLVHEVLRCLRFEEAHLLDPQTLRDDVICTDTVDG